MRERAYTYLQQRLAEPPPTNESWWPSYTAWQAFAVKVLVEGGRNQDSNITRLYEYRERMPVFGLAYLHDALVAKGETSGPRADDLRRRMANAILPEAAMAHVEELSDPYLLWFWNSNIRSTAIVLSSMVKANQADAPYASIVRWLLQARDKGRWGNTQENAMALEALVGYYRRFEATIPNFSAVVALSNQPLAREEFRGRTTDARITEVPMTKLLASAQRRSPAAAHVHEDGRRHALLFGTASLCGRPAVSTRARSGHPHRAHLCAVRRDGHQAGGDDVQGWRSRTGDPDAPAHEGAPLRRRHRSAPCRASSPSSRGSQHRLPRSPGIRTRKKTCPTTGLPGGSGAASITWSGTTTAWSSSPLGWPKGVTSSPTSFAQRPPAPSGRHRLTAKRCTSRKCSAERRRPWWR